MINRGYLKCLTCDFVTTVRVSVGHNSYQRHDFSCPECEEPIGLGMKVDYENITTEFDFLENCEEAFEEGQIVNLNPHFVVPDSCTNSDLSFSWMGQKSYIEKSSQVRAVLIKDENESPLYNFNDVYEHLGGLTHCITWWEFIKKGWSLNNNNKSSLSARHLKKYNPPGFKKTKNLSNVLIDFSYRLTLPKMYTYFVNAEHELKRAAKKNIEELKRFAKYYVENLHHEHMNRYFETYSEYFTNYSEYDQVILYVKNLASVPENCVATSYGFERTKMYYGNAYENYTSNLVVLACLNNIINGRGFDQFKAMDLNKYLTISKAKRGNPFLENDKLRVFLSCTENSLRNASHHQAMRLVDNGRNIEYKSDDAGSLNKISYSKYLEKCNEITLSMASLLQIEFQLRDYYTLN